MKNYLTTLSQIADTLYNPDSSYLELYDSCQNYKSLLLGITEIVLEEPHYKKDIYTDSGRAIGTEWAIRCVEDIMRTYKYCRGLYMAVNELAQKRPGPVRILYAGPGPFGTLVLPLITRFTPEQLQLDIIEINPLSAQLCKDVIAYFKAEDYINNFEVTDATKYQIENPEGVDVLLSETMQAALASEPQVAICYNLLPQMRKDALMIPQEIGLRLFAVNENKRQEYKVSMDSEGIIYHKDLGLLFKLDREQVDANYQKISAMGAEARFDPVTLEVPADTHRKFHHLMIATTIRVYDEQTEIKLEESGLTALRQLQPLNPMMRTVNALQASYLSGEHPGLDFQLNP